MTESSRDGFGHDTTTAEVRSYALDPAAAKQLWSVSEEMVGQSFPL